MSKPELALKAEVTQNGGLSTVHNDTVAVLQDLLDVIDSLGFRLMPLLAPAHSDFDDPTPDRPAERSEAASYVRTEIYDRATRAVEQLTALRNRIDL